MRAFRGAQLERVASSSASPAEAAHMTGHALDTWVRHYLGRGGPAQRTDARARLVGARDPADDRIVIVGLDEVGRGAWAGPLAVGAAVLPRDRRVNGVRDSKLLTES